MPLRNPVLSAIETYVPGLTTGYVAQAYGLPEADIAKLGSAENPFGPSPLGRAAVAAALDALSLYPNWTAEGLRKKIAAKYGLDPEGVICGAGETELIPLVIRAFTREGGTVAMHEPTFPVYHLAAEAEGRKPIFVPARDELVFDVDDLAAAARPDTGVAFVTSPHSPTGRVFAHADVERLARRLPDTLVVLDEAYWHFSDAPPGFNLLPRCPNLMVMRTFSKAFGLAGLRVGFAAAAPPLVRQLMALKSTWNMGCLQVAGAAAALDDDAHVQRTVAAIKEARAEIERRVNQTNRFQVLPGSQANYVLVKVLDPGLDSTRVFNELLKRGVIVKDCSVSFRALGKRWLRVDVGTRRHVDRFVAALSDIR
ncbi:MAG: histidinol-phosphate transaminase [Alphaproteobacteria bacterium]|nr:histidinol-phosphate transaminase [Alphaproteobacteria bacterium]